MAEFYVTEERAMAPGIIPKPDNPNGRLVRIDGMEQLLIDCLRHIGTRCDDQHQRNLYRRLRQVVGHD